MDELRQYIELMQKDKLIKLIISKPRKKSEEFKKIVIEKLPSGYRKSAYTDKQVFHENIKEEELCDKCLEICERGYGQVNGLSESREHILLISKKGKGTYKVKQLADDKVRLASDSHDRKKNYILKEGMKIAPLVDMGVFAADGHVIHSMYDKYRQINRFLEILDDEISKSGKQELNVIDFGCGKSYLTFVVYYYLTEIKGISVKMLGLDLKADVIKKCNASAEKYGYTALKFELGDINGYKPDFDVDMVITLHACDVATDYALYNAIDWKADMIFSVPCCQHELAKQMQPENLKLLSKYGIIKERFAALATDAIRANLLEYSGYSAQLLEFIDMEHTPKNIMIRARRKTVMAPKMRNKALLEVQEMIREFKFEPALYRLLGL